MMRKVGLKLRAMMGKWYRENQLQLLSLLERNSNAKVLDIGCSSGEFTLEVGKIIGTKRLYGIDIDKKAVERARKKRIKAVVHDANTKLPYKDGFFDVVISNQVLEHLWNTDGVLLEVRRVLKKGGYAVISTVNLTSLHNLVFMNLGLMPPGLHVSKVHVGNFLYGDKNEGHVKLFTVGALRDLARYYGFKVEALLGCGIYFLPRRLSNLLSRVFPQYSTNLTLKIRRV